MTIEHNTDFSSNDFKTARENSGLTLKELFERTRISVINLEAIENGDFHALPTPIYTRNFIKTYADVLGVDGQPVLQRYEKYLNTLQTKEKIKETEQKPGAPLAETLSRFKSFAWIMGIIIVLVSVSFFVSRHNKPTPEIPQKAEVKNEAVVLPETKTQNAVQPAQIPIITFDQNVATEDFSIVPKIMDEKKQSQQTTTATPPPSAITASAANVTPATPAPTPASAQKDKEKKLAELIDNEESSVLVIRASEDTWIRIKADDKEPFQVFIKPGEKISYKAARFSMDIGNAGGVKIKFNGKNFDNLGKSGQVIHLRLP